MGEERASCGFLAAMPRALVGRAIAWVVVSGGCLAATAVFVPPAAWGAPDTVTTEHADDGIERAGGLKLAWGCPAAFTDGDPNPPDIDILSCHTEPVTCRQEESLVD